MLNTTLDANSIYQAALGLTFTKEANAQDFKVFFLGFLNILCQEALPYENSARRAAGVPELDRAPLFTGFGEVVPYEDAIVRVALPYGVASWFFQDDMDDWRYKEMRGRFIAALQDAGMAEFGAVEADYGAGC